MLSEFWEYLPYLFKGYGICLKIIKKVWDAGTLPPPFQSLSVYLCTNNSKKKIKDATSLINSIIQEHDSIYQITLIILKSCIFGVKTSNVSLIVRNHYVS